MWTMPPANASTNVTQFAILAFLLLCVSSLAFAQGAPSQSNYPITITGGAGTPSRVSTCGAGAGTDTILATDRGGTVYEDGNGGQVCTVTLPQAGSAGFGANFSVFIRCGNLNFGCKVITSVSTIDSVAGATGTLYTNAMSKLFTLDNSGLNYRTINFYKDFGGTVTFTTNQTLNEFSEASVIVLMNCAAACVVTFANPSPHPSIAFDLISTGAAIATVNLNGTTWNGGTVPPVLTPNVPIYVSATASPTAYIGGGANGGCTVKCEYMLTSEGTWNNSIAGAVVTVVNQPNVARFFNLTTKVLGQTASVNVTAAEAASNFSFAVYSLSGTTLTRVWSSGTMSGAATGIIQATSLTTAVLQAQTNYYVAYCADHNATLVVQGTGFSSPSVASIPGLMLGGGPANTYGQDANAGEVCVAGVLPASMTSTNITNSTNNVQIPFALVTVN